MRTLGRMLAPSSWTLTIGSAGLLLAAIGLIAFNLGYLGLYGAFLPLLCGGLLFFVEVGEDVFLSLLLLAVTSALLYAVGLFALPLIICSLIITAPLASLLRRWGIAVIPETVRRDPQPIRRVLELAAILLAALSARYVLFRSGGGHIPLRIGEFETLPRFLISEVGGWVVFAFGYGAQHRIRYGALYSPSLDFASSLPSLLATGLFLVSPHVAIMTLGLNTFGIAGLYVGTLPVGAAHVLMRTLTMRRAEIERQNTRLQQMNIDMARNERLAAIGQMSSAISHQILQKVGLLGLQCDLLRDTLQDQSASPQTLVSEAHSRVDQLDGTIDDLNTTLSDLLIFSRDFVLHLEPCLLGGLLSELAEELREAAATRQVIIQYRCEDEVSPLLIDRIKLKQALLNLLKNAIEASPSSGHVTIVLQEKSEVVHVSITDQGKGVAEDDVLRLFSPFFSTKEKGTGLGLSFAQKIVELHRGKVTARNNPEGGATFLVELPARHSQEA